VSAAINRLGTPRQALRKAVLTDRIGLSDPVHDEIVEVLHRPRLARYIDDASGQETLAMLFLVATWFAPTAPVTDCRDAKDNKYLELLLASGAELLISSDEDLLVLNPWRGKPILRPAEYVALT
jgi:putative PIN family toxin of toxin-antitoxin system